MIWELIRINKRNSVILFVVMAGVLVGLGAVIGQLIGQGGGLIGGLVALGLWAVLSLVSLSAGDRILLAASQARPVSPDVHPQLFNVVEEMTIAAGLPRMPKVYIINDPAPNAFATGLRPENASVAVTAGLLARLNRDELQGVIAHEISHILHRDILYVTLAGVMLGAIVIISELFIRGFLRPRTGASRRYSGSSSRSNQLEVVLFLAALLAAVLAPILAQLLYFALSRQREYLADAGAARLTRYPQGLASALEKIATYTGPQLSVATKATAPMYIANPFKGRLAYLTSTHPPIEQRIKILRSIGNAVSMGNYIQVYRKVTGRTIALTSTDQPVQVRPAQPGPIEVDPRGQERQIGELIRKVNGFRFISCACGLNIKVPPNFRYSTIICPRCSQTLKVPQDAA